MVNSTQIGPIISTVKVYSTKTIDFLSTFLQNNFGDGTPKLLLIALGLIVIWVASSVTKRLAKFGLWIIGILLVLGTITSWF